MILRKDPDEDANWGNLIIERELKRRARNPGQDQPGIEAGSGNSDLPIQMPLRASASPATLTGNSSPVSWLHALRHTFLT